MVEIRADVLSNSKEVVKSTDNVKKLGRTTMKVAKQNKQIPDFGFKIDRLKLNLEAVNKRMKELTGPMLSAMFFGMMLQQTFTSALKSIFEGYSRAIGVGGEFNQLTERLSANWAYFKYQLAEAFANTSVFKYFIDSLIYIIQMFQEMPKPFKSFIVILLIVGVILGGLLFIFGQIGLGLLGISYILSLMPSSVVAFAGSFLLVAGAILLIIAALGLMFYLSNKGLEIQSKEYVSTWAAIKGTMIDALIGVMFFLELIPELFVLVVESLLDIGFRLGSGIAKAIIAGFTGQGWDAMKTAFTSELSQIGSDLSENFQKFVTDPALDLGNYGIELKERFNLTRDIEKATTATDDYAQALQDLQIQKANQTFDDLTNKVNAAQNSFSTTPNSVDNSVSNINYNFYSVEDAVAQGVLTSEQAQIARNNGYTA